MAKTVEKLSALGVSKMTKPGYHSDGAGLYLQVSKTITKSWIFRFTMAGKQREMGLGPLHTIGLAEARAKAKECRGLLLNGIDPLTAREERRMAASLERAKMTTFDQCATAYIAATGVVGRARSMLHNGKAVLRPMRHPSSARCPSQLSTRA